MVVRNAGRGEPRRSFWPFIKKELFDDAVITPATADGFANGFLWVICGVSCCGALVGPPAFARRGCRARKSREHEQTWRHLLFYGPIWPNRVDCSSRSFTLASRRCSRSAVSALGPRDDWHWTTFKCCGADEMTN